MESGSVPVSAASAPVFAQSPPNSTLSAADTEAARTKSLKRGHQEISQSPQHLASIASAGLSPSFKSPKFKGNFTPVPLTGASAMEDERRRREETRREDIQTLRATNAISENPRVKALESLMAGGGLQMSKLQDGPSSTPIMSEALSTAADAITMPSGQKGSGTSTSSATTPLDLRTTAQTVTANPTVVANPTTMPGLSDREGREGMGPDNTKPVAEESSSRDDSYPDYLPKIPDNLPSLPPGLPSALRDLIRGLNQVLPARSAPVPKRHKCPYCDTVFTRHHNLKSHLLTHSQEKPFLCDGCDMRFRRLHDLKRHRKLHSGERPHICPKCDRKFARGDALARHGRGQGGCAGRRTSMASFGGEEGEGDFEGSNAGDDDAGMDGVMYQSPQNNEAEMTEEDRRFSLPSIKAQHVSSNQGSQDNYTTHSLTSSTYPPTGPRQVQPNMGLYPPSTDRSTNSSATSPTSTMQSSTASHPPNSLSMALSTGGGSMFAQSGMTESPKPLSPAGVHSHQLGHDASINRARSPSLATQFHQQNYGHHQSGRVSPSIISLPSPHSTTQSQRLPSIAGLAPPEQKYTLSSQAPTHHTPTTNGAPQGQGQSTTDSPSTTYQPSRSYPPPSPRHQGSGSGDSSNNLFASGEQGVWSYVKTLEGRVEQMTNEISAMQGREKLAQDQIRSQHEQIKQLTEEATFLRSHFAPHNQPPHSGRS